MSLSDLQNAALQLPPNEQQALLRFLLSQYPTSTPSKATKMRILGAAESDFQAANAEEVLQDEWSRVP